MRVEVEVPECGVWHGDPCQECEGRGFHREGCSLSDEEGPVPSYACETPECRSVGTERMRGGERYCKDHAPEPLPGEEG